jgi:dienelactone hydrolase
MPMRQRSAVVAGVLLVGFASMATAADPPLDEYFRAETARLAARPLKGIESAEAWTAARPELQRQLREMLGLDPWPEKTDLHARITGVVERPDFIVEKLLYQSRPGLYVTGNLYLPKVVRAPLPAILYVCGHSEVKKGGIIYGNKAHYQHHAAWYAANGYVCLILDTLQLGELPGLHHGTNREGMWWWQSRGYTPAGVEAWNGIRGIDYLLSRPEVDEAKIGVTGRSGGGATSWWLGALDDRVAAVVPVAGITDLRNHVVDGVLEGHCDCMYPVNTYRWDFPLLAALVAPKPLLVENTDKDPIFPEDGVRRVYAQLEKVYGWYEARDRLGLVIGKGGHVDSPEIRRPSFAFMDRWLKGKDTDPATIEEPDRSIPVEDLKVLKPGEVPPDCRNATIQETFVARAEVPPVPESAEAWEKLRIRWLDELKAKVLAGWPQGEDVPPLKVELALDAQQDGMRLRGYDFTSQEGVRLRLWWVSPAASARKPEAIQFTVVDERSWDAESKHLVTIVGLSSDDWMNDFFARFVRPMIQRGSHMASLGPRGIGPTAWPAERETHLRRRFALLGQTLDGMRAWDVHRALAVLKTIPELKGVPIHLGGNGQMSVPTLLAALGEPEVERVMFTNLPTSVRDGPSFLNLERFLEMPQALSLLYPKPIVLLNNREARRDADPEAWRWASRLAERLGVKEPWPRIAKSEGKQ